MTKVKYLLVLLVSVMLILVGPNISNAATEYKYSDTEQGIEWAYELDENENVINLRCTTTTITGAVTIPSTLDGKTVISLAAKNWMEGAFKGCSGITEVTIPNTITTIGRYAFAECIGLKTVTIPDSVITIDNSAFYKCSGLTSINLSTKLISIGNNAFQSCSGLKAITIPDSVTSIGTAAFLDCNGLIEINLSKNLSKIEKRTFENCTSLKSVIIPNGVTTIDGDNLIYGAFENCSNLEKILIPDTVSYIAKTAFDNCDKLTIYGNDNQVSKDYAETYEIPFDYIANWDKENSGKDITAPTVKSIFVTYSSVFMDTDYDDGTWYAAEGTNLVLKVSFSENVVGTTAPTLTIKFGDGNNIELTEGVFTGETITYTYTVKNTDKGVLTSVNLSEGDAKDEAGNVAILSCPILNVQYSDSDIVFANGTANDSNNGAGNINQGTNDGPNSNDKENTNNESTNKEDNKNETTTGKVENNNNTSTEKEETKNDSTKAPGKIPHAGMGIGIMVAIVATILACVVVYSRYNKMKDII